jgi:hypothetical protein
MWRDCVSELWTSAVYCSSPRLYEYREPRWNDTDRENQRIRRITSPTATLSARNPTLSDPDMNVGLCCERLATSCLSQSTAHRNHATK